MSLKLNLEVSLLLNFVLLFMLIVVMGDTSEIGIGDMSEISVRTVPGNYAASGSILLRKIGAEGGSCLLRSA